MAWATAVRSLTSSCVQTCRLVTMCMAGPPGCGYSLESRHQFGNGRGSQDRGRVTRLGGKIGATDRDVGELVGAQLDLAMTDVSWQVGEAGQFQNPAI